MQSWKFIFHHHKQYSLRLGLTHYGMDPAKRAPPFDCYKQKGLPRQCFVYVVHATCLAMFCLLFTHVQGKMKIDSSKFQYIYIKKPGHNKQYW